MQSLFSWFALYAFFAWQKACFPDCRPREILSKSYNFHSTAAGGPIMNYRPVFLKPIPEFFILTQTSNS
jgi:hypothetical protein